MAQPRPFLVDPSPSCGLSVVIPCFNEEESLTLLHRRVSDAATTVADTDYELVLVNDGSTDRTWEGIRRICDDDPHVVGVDLSRNHGHQLALSAGLSVCCGKRILILDADLQDPPELLPDMYRVMDGSSGRAPGGSTARLAIWWTFRSPSMPATSG
jgi:dolichol-phosphate mannosyltransferase